MMNFSGAMLTDVLADCQLEDTGEDFSDFVDASFLDTMTTLHEQQGRGYEEGRGLTESDFMNTSYVPGEVIADDILWSHSDVELCPDEVMLEVEVITEWIDEEGERTLIDLDNVSHSPNSQASTSDYGSDTSADHNTSEIDLCQNGSLDLSKSSTYTEQRAALDYSQPYPHAVQNGSLDVGQAPDLGLQGSRYMHCGGSLVLNRSGEIEQHNGLLDLSKTGSYYQLPRIKLEPGLGIDPSIQYKPEMDFNHNEAYSPLTKMESSVYNNHSHENAYKQNEDIEMYSETQSDQTDVYTEEEAYTPPQCQNIPLTVTSPDDDEIDSGTESSGSVISDKSSGNTINQNNRKRPGRKKGQVSKVYHLWEFIRDVLADPKFCPSVIKWENEEEGIFRVIQSEVAATLWGQKKNNRTKMTYEKMSRSIRYSRKEGYFDDIPKDKGYPKKLCFKFGKKAYGWSTRFNK